MMMIMKTVTGHLRVMRTKMRTITRTITMKTMTKMTIRTAEECMEDMKMKMKKGVVTIAGMKGIITGRLQTGIMMKTRGAADQEIMAAVPAPVQIPETGVSVGIAKDIL